MNKKRTKTIRILLALLVMLTIGGTQRAWADDLSDINTNLTFIAPDGSGCTAEATSYVDDPNGHCELLKVVLQVTPAAGYYTNLDLITAVDKDNVTTLFPKSYGDGVTTSDEADTDPSKNYSSTRSITIYWGNNDSSEPNPSNIKITVRFKSVELELRNGLGEYNAALTGAPDMQPKAKMTFFNGGTTEPNKETFNPTADAYKNTNQIYSINNADGDNRYIIVHIEPADGYWTDESLLCAYEAGAAAALTRASAPGIDLGRPLKLLTAEEYNTALPGDDPVMKPCHNGAGWYYYELPGSHKFSFEKTGYKYSIIDGFVPKQFYLNGSNVWNPTSKVLTVTDGTTNGWSVEFTYDEVSYPFDGNTHRPKVDKLTVKYQGKTVIEYDGSTATGRTSIDNQVVNGDGNDDCIIRDSHTINTKAAQNYPNCWFISGDYDAKFAITVPFSGSGTKGDPWLIKGGKDLTKLAKCVNIGYYPFTDQWVVLDETCAYDVAADYAEFEPIGMKGEVYFTPFCGIFDGKGKTISGISYTYNPGLIVSDPSAVNSIGLFGQLGDSSSEPVGVGIVKNVNLKNCTFATEYDKTFYVGGIAGYIDRGGIYNSTVSGGTVSASNTSSHTGAIFGHKNSSSITLDHNYYTFDTKVTLGSGTSATTASGYTKRGGYVGTDWDDITADEGAMLYVKLATLNLTKTGANDASTLAFSQTNVGDNCYDGSGSTYYYVPGDNIVLTATYHKRINDGRTFYEEVSVSAKDGSTTPADITVTPTTATLTDDTYTSKYSFTMPETGATVTAKIQGSDWFTIPSNLHNWMTFYHEWESENDPRDYVVSDGSGTGKTIDVKTVANIDPDKGSFDFADIDGDVSFFGVPTIFHYADKSDATAVLPALLKFTPVDPTKSYSKPSVAPQFKGTLTGETLDASDKCYVLNNVGDFILAYVSGTDNKILARRCYVDLKDNPTNARVLKMNGGDNATGIHSIDNGQLTMDNADGAWYGIDGRKLQGKPAKKGVYIYIGKKTVVK